MSAWPTARARGVLAALKRIGWRHDRTVESHKIMKKDGWAMRGIA
jgi:predicted RNA binding protein YcfA (HicA-like mRNA interferase family)